MKLGRLWRRRKSVIVAWLISYTAVVFFPILMSVIMYLEASINLKSEINRANDALLKQVRDTVDTQIERMKRMNTELTWNLKVQDLFYSKKRDNEARYTAYEIVNEFKVYQTSYSSIDEFYVTWDSGQNVLFPGSVRELHVTFDAVHNTGELTYTEWEQKLLQGSGSRFMVVPRFGTKSSNQALALVSHLPASILGKSPGTVVIMTDVTWFRKAVANILGFSGGELFILDESNQVLISNSGSPPSAALLERLNRTAQEESTTSVEVDGSELFYIKSGVSGLKYVSVIPSDIYWKKAEYVRRFTYISILCSIAGAGVLTIFFTHRNYSPIRKLVQALSGNDKEQRIHSSVNELGFIQNAVVHALSEREQIARQLLKQSHMLRSNMLNRMLKGKRDPHIPIDEAFSRFDIHFESDDFAVILFYAEEALEFSADDPEADLQSEDKQVHFIMTSVLEELVGNRLHRGYVTELDEMHACIVNFSSNGQEHYSKDLLTITLEVQQQLREQYNIRLSISYSGIHQTVDGIAQAYQEALDAMEYKLVLGKPEITSYEEIQKDVLTENQLGYYYPLQVEQKLINYIKVGDFDKASAVLKDIADRNFNKPLSSITLARCVMFNMISTMIKTINEIGGMEDSFLAKNPRWMEQIAACRTIREMYGQLIFLLKEVCEYASVQITSNATNNKTESVRGLVAEVMEYVKNNYQDINLNINMIGKQFDLKPSYLSQIFKNLTGEGLLDYIGKHRVEMAKLLLREQSMSITEISRLVGFTEAATFIRVFKKYEGITPGKYKDLEC